MSVMGYWQALMERSGWRFGEEDKEQSSYKDPKCPKCGLTLGNKMYYVCRQSHCPAGLN